MGCAREGGVGTEVRVVGYARQDSPNSACPRIRRFLSLTMRGWAPFWRPNLAYGYTFLARQEPKKSCIGNKDLAPFWRFCCGLLILIVKDEEFVLVNHGRTVITFTPGSYVLYIPKNRLWGPKNGPGAVSRRHETPRNSRTLRDRSRGQKCCTVPTVPSGTRLRRAARSASACGLRAPR